MLSLNTKISKSKQIIETILLNQMKLQYIPHISYLSYNY